MRLGQESSAPRADAESPAAVKPRRSLRVYIYASLFLLLGLSTGQIFRAVVVPPPLPIPDTEDDELTKSRIRKAIDALPLVQELRAQVGQWLEYEAYMTKPSDERATSMTAGALAGSRGIGVQRVFWHRSEQRLVSVVFVGGATSGWPGVMHGGAVATLLQENLERVTNGPEVLGEQTGHYDMSHFDITYKKPTNSNLIYYIRAEIDDSKPQQAGHIAARATMENALDGVVTAKATGTCSSGLVQQAKEEGQSTIQWIGRSLGW